MFARACLRWWDIDLDIGLSGGSGGRGRDVDWVDPVIGAKAQFPLGGRWSCSVRGDVGGFGVESDFSWTAAAGVLYRFSERFSVELQYKATGVDYDEGVRGSPGYFSYDTITHGPLLGMSIEF
jgi:opacity protein-like surface antigen